MTNVIVMRVLWVSIILGIFVTMIAPIFAS